MTGASLIWSMPMCWSQRQRAIPVGALIDPVGEVNHRGPWVLTVAASTKDGETAGQLSAVGPGNPPPNLQDIALDRGSASPVGDPLNDFPMRHFSQQDTTMEGCTAASPQFPPGFFNGSVALIHRGTCTFTEKITNAFNAGAAMVVIWNNVATPLLMIPPASPMSPLIALRSSNRRRLSCVCGANPNDRKISISI